MKEQMVSVVGIVAAMVSSSAFAAPGQGFLYGAIGISSVGAEETYSGGDSLELERGDGLNLTGGLSLTNGLGFRLDYVATSHDGGTVCSGGCIEFSDEVELSETRAVILFNPIPEKDFSVEFGGGFVSFGAEIPSAGVDSNQDGLVFEGSMIFKPRDTLILRAGLALLSLEDDEGDDVTGAEFKVGGLLSIGSLDLGAQIRGLAFEEDDTFTGETIEQSFGEFRATIGTHFGI